MHSTTIFNFASLFGATFVCSNEMHLLLVISLQILFLLITASQIPASLCCIYSLMHGILLNYQVTLPTILEVLMNIEAWMKPSVELKIRNEIGSESCTKASRVFILKFSILLFVRGLKYYYIPHALEFVLSTFLNELVTSTCSYLFCFYVDLLRQKIKGLRSSLINNEIDVADLEKEISKLHELSDLIYNRFSTCLIINIVYDFITLIVNLYYTFIRVVYGPWSVATLFFNIQPTMNMFSLFTTCHNCTKEVKKIVLYIHQSL